MLKVLQPLSLIASPVGVDVDAEAMSLIAAPAALVDLSLCVSEAALAECPPQDPLSLECGPIRP